METLVETQCVAPGFWGFIFSFAHAFPYLVWVVKSSNALETFTLRDWYFIFAFKLELVLNIILQQVFRELRPFPECAGGFGFPSRETQLAYMSLVLLLHKMFAWRGFFWPTIKSYWISLLLLGFYVPFGLWYSGMNTFLQILAGVIIGLSSGLVRVYLYKYFIFPLAPALREFFGTVDYHKETDNLF